MCDCIDVKIGSYHNCEILESPWGKRVTVDKCLVGEILSLWDIGIETAGCCCGHNIRGQEPYINVYPEYHAKMIEIGYSYRVNIHGVGCYKPKSVVNEGLYKRILPI